MPLPRTTPVSEALIEVLGLNRDYFVDEDAISIHLTDDPKVVVTFTIEAYRDALALLGVDA